MNRMTPVTVDSADPVAAPILEGFKTQYGMIPNFFAALGVDGASLCAYLNFAKALEENDLLTERLREMIALAVANANGCHYCVSGHTFSGKKAGLSPEECIAAQCGKAEDAREQAALTLALRLIEARGHLEDVELAGAREAGLSEPQIVQICAWTGLNAFSNWINNLARPKIDFPKVPLQP